MHHVDENLIANKITYRKFPENDLFPYLKIICKKNAEVQKIFC